MGGLEALTTAPATFDGFIETVEARARSTTCQAGDEFVRIETPNMTAAAGEFDVKSLVRNVEERFETPVPHHRRRLASAFHSRSLGSGREESGSSTSSVISMIGSRMLR